MTGSVTGARALQPLGAGGKLLGASPDPCRVSDSLSLRLFDGAAMLGESPTEAMAPPTLRDEIEILV